MSLKIKSFCRCHHLQSKEIQQPMIYEVDLDSNNFFIENSKLSYADYSLEIKKNKYKFDKLYDEAPQTEISQDLLKLLIRDVFLNSNIFHNFLRKKTIYKNKRKKMFAYGFGDCKFWKKFHNKWK